VLDADHAVRHHEHVRRIVRALGPYFGHVPHHPTRGCDLELVRRAWDENQRAHQERDGECRRQACREVDEDDVVPGPQLQEIVDPPADIVGPEQREVEAADREPAWRAPGCGTALLVIVDQHHPGTQLGESAGQVYRERALPGPALEIAHRHDVGRTVDCGSAQLVHGPASTALVTRLLL
jgi:hypothetical protein